MDEFALIARYFRDLGASRDDVLLGVGDDAALLRPAPDSTLAVTTDTLIEDVHFPASITPADLAWRSAAVNLSDLAAMGADPAFATLALCLPEARSPWLKAFSQGLDEALREANVALVGGNTARGKLSVTLQLVGLLNAPGMLRSGARVGDTVFVSGTLGDARAALDILDGSLDAPGRCRDVLLRRYFRPTPRVALGRAVRGLASAAIDISDGLVADLGHVAEASGIGMRIELDRLPVSASLRATVAGSTARALAATGGDDYEIALTAAPSAIDAVLNAAADTDIELTAIGEVTVQPGVRVIDERGEDIAPRLGGYRHF